MAAVARPPERIQRSASGDLVSVSAKMNYMDNEATARCLVSNGQLFTNRDLGGSDSGSKGGKGARKEVQVLNARLLHSPSLDAEGFELVQAPSALGRAEDFYDEKQILGRYYPQCIELVKQATGAAFVAAFDHNVRSATGKQAGRQIQGGGNLVQGVAMGVHSDYTMTSGPARLEQLGEPPRVNDTMRKFLGTTPLVPAEAVERVKKRGCRFAIVNVWRNILDEPVEVYPLAFCDAQSTDREDFAVFEIRYADRTGENYICVHEPRHRWCYYPKITRDEAVLLKQWDSEGTLLGGGRATFAMHSAFKDPTTPTGAVDRESIEVRCICVFPKNSGDADPPAQSKL